MADTFSSLRGRIGAFSRAALPDQARFTEAARGALVSKFERQATDLGPCSDAEMERRIKALKSAHYSRLALKSAKARRRRAQKESPVRESGETVREAGEKDQVHGSTERPELVPA